MLKYIKFSGVFRDENLSVSVTLENPRDYGFEATNLLLSIMVRSKNGAGATLNLEDFTYYVMDEAGRLYNAQSIPYSRPDVETAFEYDEPVQCPDGLLYTYFKHDFLFQDMRIAFDYRPYQRISIIELRH